ncbi:MAG: tRNA (adenosine(37)-N6)-dimethylallyltransferase MiaA [Tannerella sp.]|jgi:tRNA dimethylallyltransferase|nr:tRNA (adenosine(37)-N6)-dimethylallyltransferase MiaA [Tannerella sp.]
MKKYELITVLGPTACGKTQFAVTLAAHIHSEIISADSRQVYRHMDIGTGKDLNDYIIDGKQVPYHLIDICEPGTKYNVFQYQHDFFNIFNKLRNTGITPVLCGGTGMYIEAVLKGYKLLDVPPNPELRGSLAGKSLEELEEMLAGYKTLHNKTDVDSVQRAIRAIEIEEYYKKEAPERNEFKPVNSLIIGLDIDREVRRKKISRRLYSRLEEGMVDEVRALLDSGIHPDDLIYYGLEYKYLTQYITGELTYEEMTKQLEIAIHQFAKRQMTWFRGMERRGFTIHWIDAATPMDGKIARFDALLNNLY